MKKFFRNVYRFFSRIYWAGRLGELGPRALIYRNSHWHNPKAIALGAGVLIKNDCQLSVRQGRGHGSAIRLRIGDESSLQRGCKISASQSITIGRQVMMASNVFIIDHDHVFDHPTKPASMVRELRSAPVVIEDGCWLGYGSVVLKGVRIGRRSVIGANAVVTRDIPPYSVAVGNPARVVRTIDVSPKGG